MKTQNAASRSVGFEQEAAETLDELRSVLRRWVEGLDAAGQPVTTASELQRATRLDMKLCWKIFRVLESPDALAACLFVPGDASLRSLRNRLKRAAGAQFADEFAGAARRFEALVNTHAGDRQTFDSMVSQWTGEPENRLNLQHRRAAFRANSHIWGIQAEARISTYIIRPSVQSGDLLDAAMLSGRIGLRRLRPTPSPLFSQFVGTYDDDGAVRHTFARQPLDPDQCGDSGVPIVREFCSDNLPHIVTERTSDGFVHATLPSDMVGLKSAVTVVTGQITPGFATRFRDDHNAVAGHTAFVEAPLKTLIADFIVADETLGEVSPRAEVYADRTGGLPFPAGDQRKNLLSIETVMRLGRGTRVLRTPVFERYPELVERALETLGLEADRCTTYRCRIDYPVMLSRAAISAPLPERP